MLNKYDMSEDMWDVVVAGGGPTGFVAAIAAARNGAKTLLIERYGFLGGQITFPLPLITFHTAQGEQVIEGIPQEVVDRATELGGASGHIKVASKEKKGVNWMYFTPLDPEILKFIAQEMVLEAGAKLLFHSLVTGVEMEGGTIRKVIVHNKSGRQEIPCRVAIDATGDADVAYFSGVPFEMGRPEDGLVQTSTLMFTLDNVDTEKFAEFFPPDVVGVKFGEREESAMHFSGSFAPWQDIVEKESLFPDKNHQFWAGCYRRGKLSINTVRLTQVDGTDASSLTDAEIKARRQVVAIANFLTEHVAGFESSYVMSTGVQVGLRESRRIKGLYVLTEDDVTKGRKFEDAIARIGHPLDMHDPTGKGVFFNYIEGNGSYHVPYQCLVPQKVDNLLVGGRCISVTHRALASTRVTAPCMALGQAAGTAAALASKQGLAPAGVNIKELQQRLIDQRVNLEDLEV